MVTRRDRSERIAAEATAWLARLESTGRTPSTEAGLRAWLLADDAHRQSFERAMDIWAIIPGAAELLAVSLSPARKRSGFRHFVEHGRAIAMAASLLIVCFVSGWFLIDGSTSYSTVIGEQQVATLEDGSRIALNADTQLKVHYDKASRSVQLDKGEAMFEVAHNARRPFTVEAGNKRITALGTSFIVRKSGDSVAVILLSGKVRVDTLGEATEARAPATILSPGEQLMAAPQSPEVVTRTSAEAATAWRRGQIVFDETSLSAALTELGRYGGQHIDLADPRLGGLTVSGVFATNDTAEFAHAVAALHDLRVEQSDSGLRLARK